MKTSVPQVMLCVICFQAFFLWEGKEGDEDVGGKEKQGKCSKVLRDLPFIDSIFWAFKVYRKVSETAKM